MKKIIIKLLVFVMVLCLFAGCSATPSPESTETPTASETPLNPGGVDHGGGAGMVTPTTTPHDCYNWGLPTPTPNPGGGDHGGGAGMVTPTPYPVVSK